MCEIHVRVVCKLVARGVSMRLIHTRYLYIITIVREFQCDVFIQGLCMSIHSRGVSMSCTVFIHETYTVYQYISI